MGRFSDWLQEVEEILDVTLFNKWLWIIIGAMAAIVVLPLAVMSIILLSPSWLATVFVILIIISWGIAGGYKEYSLHKRKQEKAKLHGQDTIPFTYERGSDKDEEHD